MSTQADKLIKFFFLTDITLKERNKLKHYLGTIFKKEGRNIQYINYIFCSDEYLLNINKQYLNHNYYTDIITFDLSEDKKAISAEIYISTERVKENAKTNTVSVKEEIHRVIFHGALHLCGYGDKTEAQELQMREKENLHLAKYFK